MRTGGDILKGDSKAYDLSEANFTEVQGKIEEDLAKRGIEKRQALRASLLLEELFYSLQEHGIRTVKISIHRRFGAVSLKLGFSGEEFNPLRDDFEWEDAGEDGYRNELLNSSLEDMEHFGSDGRDVTYYIRSVLLKANRDYLGYSRRDGQNVISILVSKDKNRQGKHTVLAMVLGIITGAIMNEIASVELLDIFDWYLADSIRTMFMNSMNMMLAPVVFFSVIDGLTNISNAKELGRIGSKMTGMCFSTTIFAVAFSLLVGMVIFGGDMPHIGELQPGTAASLSIRDMIVGIIPKRLTDPITNGNMLQVIFLSVLFGITINIMGEKGRPLADFVKTMDNFCLTIIRLIVKFIPLVAFFSMTALMFKVGVDSIFALIRAFVAQGAVLILMLSAYGGLIAFMGGVSPRPFIRKIVGFMPIPASLGSTNAAMPFALDFCMKRMGVRDSLAAFTIPIAASMKMDGNCTFLILQSMMLSRLYGVEFTSGFLFTLIVTAVVLSSGSPGVTGGAVVCLASIAVSLGIPIEAVGMSIAVDPIISMLRTPLNTVGGIVITTLLARSEGMLDERVYCRIK